MYACEYSDIHTCEWLYMYTFIYLIICVSKSDSIVFVYTNMLGSNKLINKQQTIAGTEISKYKLFAFLIRIGQMRKKSDWRFIHEFTYRAKGNNHRLHGTCTNLSIALLKNRASSEFFFRVPRSCATFILIYLVCFQSRSAHCKERR